MKITCQMLMSIDDLSDEAKRLGANYANRLWKNDSSIRHEPIPKWWGKVPTEGNNLYIKYNISKEIAKIAEPIFAGAGFISLYVELLREDPSGESWYKICALFYISACYKWHQLYSDNLMKGDNDYCG